MAGRLYRPRAKKSFWLLLRRLLGRTKCRPAAPEEDGDKSSLLRGASLEELLKKTSGAGGDNVDVSRFAPRYRARKDGELGVISPAVARSEARGAPAGGAPVQHRRFMFGGFRRRLMMRRPWQPMLVAIPE